MDKEEKVSGSIFGNFFRGQTRRSAPPLLFSILQLTKYNAKIRAVEM